MARPLRIEEPGLTYHVWSRGVARMAIYKDDHDRRQFLTLVARAFENDAVECHGFCEMTNHYHLVITTNRANLSHAIQQLNSSYAEWWNHRHSRCGHVFQARFGAQVVQDDYYLATACLYVALNPARAGLVDSPEQWRWSSYRATAGIEEPPPFLQLETLWRYLGGESRKTAQALYRELGAAALRDKKVRLCADPVLGDDAFRERFEHHRNTGSLEVPKRERRPARPLRDLFARALSPRDRGLAALAAHQAGYSLADIANLLEVHYSTVSKMIKRATDDETLRSVTSGSEAGSGLDSPDPSSCDTFFDQRGRD